jgi:hypothetical protein
MLIFTVKKLTTKEIFFTKKKKKKKLKKVKKMNKLIEKKENIPETESSTIKKFFLIF